MDQIVCRMSSTMLFYALGTTTWLILAFLIVKIAVPQKSGIFLCFWGFVAQSAARRDIQRGNVRRGGSIIQPPEHHCNSSLKNFQIVMRVSVSLVAAVDGAGWCTLSALCAAPSRADFCLIKRKTWWHFSMLTFFASNVVCQKLCTSYVCGHASVQARS